VKGFLDGIPTAIPQEKHGNCMGCYHWAKGIFLSLSLIEGEKPFTVPLLVLSAFKFRMIQKL